MKRVVCWLRGHHWQVTRTQWLWELFMAHLCCGVGLDRTCARCDLRYDFTNPNVALWGEPIAAASPASRAGDGEQG